MKKNRKPLRRNPRQPVENLKQAISEDKLVLDAHETGYPKTGEGEKEFGVDTTLELNNADGKSGILSPRLALLMAGTAPGNSQGSDQSSTSIATKNDAKDKENIVAPLRSLFREFGGSKNVQVTNRHGVALAVTPDDENAQFGFITSRAHVGQFADVPTIVFSGRDIDQSLKEQLLGAAGDGWKFRNVGAIATMQAVMPYLRLAQTQTSVDGVPCSPHLIFLMDHFECSASDVLAIQSAHTYCSENKMDATCVFSSKKRLPSAIFDSCREVVLVKEMKEPDEGVELALSLTYPKYSKTPSTVVEFQLSGQQMKVAEKTYIADSIRDRIIYAKNSHGEPNVAIADDVGTSKSNVGKRLALMPVPDPSRFDKAWILKNLDSLKNSKKKSE